MPVIKPNSTEPRIVDVFAALASFASNTRPLSRPDKNQWVYPLLANDGYG
jgi:hypothetical protein